MVSSCVLTFPLSVAVYCAYCSANSDHSPGRPVTTQPFTIRPDVGTRTRHYFSATCVAPRHCSVLVREGNRQDHILSRCMFEDVKMFVHDWRHLLEILEYVGGSILCNTRACRSRTPHPHTLPATAEAPSRLVAQCRSRAV